MIYSGGEGNVTELKQNGNTLNLLYHSINKWSINNQNTFNIS
jgi:hypothetical protein